jgi:methylated-DNA-[protein]-cysteine S-methyltransferase
MISKLHMAGRRAPQGRVKPTSSPSRLLYDVREVKGWGRVLAAISSSGVRRIDLRPGKNPIAFFMLGGEEIARSRLALDPLFRELEEHFAGRRRSFDSTPDLSRLTSFTRLVLREASRIRWGRTLSYGELAERIGRPEAARAVGGAMGRNPVPVLVPCHRVTGANGKPGGFTGGMDLKRRLLAIEKRRSATPR